MGIEEAILKEVSEQSLEQGIEQGIEQKQRTVTIRSYKKVCL
jgi:hypothetical protein